MTIALGRRPVRTFGVGLNRAAYRSHLTEPGCCFAGRQKFHSRRLFIIWTRCADMKGISHR